jgi:hypothetical protein
MLNLARLAGRVQVGVVSAKGDVKVGEVKSFRLYNLRTQTKISSFPDEVLADISGAVEQWYFGDKDLRFEVEFEFRLRDPTLEELGLEHSRTSY